MASPYGSHRGRGDFRCPGLGKNLSGGGKKSGEDGTVWKASEKVIQFLTKASVINNILK
jgi:hypothetical protein